MKPQTSEKKYLSQAKFAEIFGFSMDELVECEADENEEENNDH